MGAPRKGPETQLWRLCPPSCVVYRVWTEKTKLFGSMKVHFFCMSLLLNWGLEKAEKWDPYDESSHLLRDCPPWWGVNWVGSGFLEMPDVSSEG